MVAAGMFEYNFGDSEFLMLFLVLVTLPYAAERVPRPRLNGRRRSVTAAIRRPRSTARPPRRPHRSWSIGDLMLDQFVIGTVDRISPEAPVPVVRFDHETWRLGGAANVANNVVALGGRVEAIGVVGNDADGGRLLEDLARRRIGTGGIVERRVPLHDARSCGW